VAITAKHCSCSWLSRTSCFRSSSFSHRQSSCVCPALMPGLIDLALRNRVLVLALYVGLAGWGYWALRATPIDAIPSDPS
jgi:hypothetical protein